MPYCQNNSRKEVKPRDWKINLWIVLLEALLSNPHNEGKISSSYKLDTLHIYHLKRTSRCALDSNGRNTQMYHLKFAGWLISQEKSSLLVSQNNTRSRNLLNATSAHVHFENHKSACSIKEQISTKKMSLQKDLLRRCGLKSPLL